MLRGINYVREERIKVTMSVRTERVGGEIQKIVSASIAREHSDVTDGLLTVTEVSMSPDLRNAKVYVSILGGMVAEGKVIRRLNERMHEIRGDVGRNMHLRYIPELHFYLDDSSSHAARVSELLAQWHEKERNEDTESHDSEKEIDRDVPGE